VCVGKDQTTGCLGACSRYLFLLNVTLFKACEWVLSAHSIVFCIKLPLS
jgi:hypothetical protein